MASDARSGTHRAAIRFSLMESEQEQLRQRLTHLKERKWRTDDPAAATVINDEIAEVETHLRVRDELALENQGRLPNPRRDGPAR